MTPTARIYATVTGPVAIFTDRTGHTEPVTTTGTEDIRHAVVRRATTEARDAGTTLELITSGDRGDHHLLVGADGTLAPYPDAEHPPLRADRTTIEPPADSVPLVTATEDETEETGEAEEASVPAPRASFIDPASTSRGSGVLARLGITLPPTPRQVERDRQVTAVSRHWAGCRTIAIANGKGGVGKTLTTAMLAAVYGRHGGGNVLAWDNNDTRGTLGWRTEQGLYDTTIRDLLPASDTLLAADAGVSDITRYVHHQGADRYDVLRSNPELLAVDQRLTADDFDRLMRVASRYYRLVIFDSGNDESADRWLRMIDSAGQLVIPTLTAPESAESARLLLDALRTRDKRSRHLADNAIVIVTQSEPGRWADARRIADAFDPLVREVRLIPYDAALKAGPLRFDTLRPTTRHAWVAAAAAVADGLE